MYNPITNSWEEISYISVGRSRWFAAVLPDNHLFVVGGWTGKNEHTDRVEIAIINLSMTIVLMFILSDCLIFFVLAVHDHTINLHLAMLKVHMHTHSQSLQIFSS